MVDATDPVVMDATVSVCRNGVMIAKKKRSNKLGTVKLFVRLQEIPATGHTALIFWKSARMADTKRLDPMHGSPKGKYYWAIHDVRPLYSGPLRRSHSGCSLSRTLISMCTHRTSHGLRLLCAVSPIALILVHARPPIRSLPSPLAAHGGRSERYVSHIGGCDEVGELHVGFSKHSIRERVGVRDALRDGETQSRCRVRGCQGGKAFV